jgi:hypothetical protein
MMPSNKIRVNVMLNEDQISWLKRESAIRGESVSVILRELINKKMNEKEGAD